MTSASATGLLSDTLAERLDIPPHLFKKHGFVSLQHAYQRYKAFHAAHERMINMGKDGTWGGKLPVKNDLMEVFAGRSTFYIDYVKLFDQVPAYPVLVGWLEEEKGAPSASELFGGVKRSYGFRELRDYLGSVKPGQEPGHAKKRKAGEVLEKKTVKKVAKVDAKAGGSRRS
jgi:hypothetical protein